MRDLSHFELGGGAKQLADKFGCSKLFVVRRSRSLFTLLTTLPLISSQYSSYYFIFDCDLEQFHLASSRCSTLPLSRSQLISSLLPIERCSCHPHRTHTIGPRLLSISPMPGQNCDPPSNAPLGSILSHTRHTLRNLLLRFAVRALRLISPSMDALMKRIQYSPGIPVPNPSTPYWSTPPSPISRHGSDAGSILPSYADVVIIGSGITGASFARTLLDYDADHARKGEPLQVVMLEAREACSGATGRWAI